MVLQGALGKLRVMLFKDEIGIFHATLAQMFFALICAMALFTSRWWAERRTPIRRGAGTQAGSRSADSEIGAPMRRWFLAATILIFLQLILGATMRHQHAGLAIPDFPLAYGKLWPAIDPASVEQYNRHRIEVLSANSITQLQILLQMGHRFLAGLILVGVGCCA